ncbi:nucleotide-diphospho-sugar transferase [Aspergillus eucalypticola CBS 122712]|uniref:Nucleotide-diphospho-sugar transferase n=1 Tax=Aspergillus eucalypticola (strain CBS 122712 / IBT 29274) TaxID=1448314 RepID=A0A317V842_ASPEC|nr:nucleotide-diphospho-sugar transferase [Aspergillus eucalypticola CBS 122712]PWY70543.1 nucleotide-diphospho-sugar transferase [Aspergillus eucalypticola CBS 122712]
MAAFRAQLRRRSMFITLGLVAIFIWTLASCRSQNTTTSTSHEQFWTEFHPMLVASEPYANSPTRIRNAESEGFDPKNTDPLPDLLRLSKEDVSAMRIAHSKFLDMLKQTPPKLHYQAHTRGLVSTAGGSYLPVLVISLRMLRQSGSNLPMEVFLASWDEYDGYVCQVVLPSLNAQCVVLSEILDAVTDSKASIEKYQYKIFAMMFSSFEEILFLDADAFALQDPEVLFKSEPFSSKGLVTWPDFWRPTTSPLYYEIVTQDKTAGKNKEQQIQQQQNPATIRQSTESGELLLSKRTHTRTLLLAAYYNFYGPSHYYPLLSQGAAGEGDKETFVAAAIVLNEPFYQVSEPIRAVGRGTPDGFAGSTMVQYNPIEDYALTKKGEWRIRGAAVPPPHPFFVHVNFPKFNPATVFNDNGPVVDERGRYTRAWTAPDDVVEAFGGIKTEKAYWKEILWTACALEGKSISWKGRDDICSKTTDYWSTIFEKSEGLDLT